MLRVLVALILATAGVLPMVDLRTSTAATCSMGSLPNPNERLSIALGWSQLIVIGQVVDETRIEPDYSTQDPGDYIASKDQSEGDDGVAFQSTVRLDAILAGDHPSEELTLVWLSEGWLCVGGPRLLEGERVLLLLHQEATWRNPDGPQGLIWATGPLGGNILLEGGNAFLNDYQAPDGPQYLGSAGAVIRQIADASGASPEATAAALEAAQLGTADNGVEAAFAGGAVVLVSVASLGLLLLIQRRRSI